MTISIKKFELTGREDKDDATVTKAIFDAEFSGMRLVGCAVIRKSDGYLMAMTPRSAYAGRDAFHFTDDDLLAEFRALGLRAYEAMTGESNNGRPQLGAGQRESLRQAGM